MDQEPARRLDHVGGGVKALQVRRAWGSRQLHLDRPAFSAEVEHQVDFVPIAGAEEERLERAPCVVRLTDHLFNHEALAELVPTHGCTSRVRVSGTLSSAWSSPESRQYIFRTLDQALAQVGVIRRQPPDQEGANQEVEIALTVW